MDISFGWKSISLAALVALTPVSPAFAARWLKSLSEAEHDAQANNQLIFVDLFADWCGWCHRVEQEVIPSQQFQNATRSLVLLRLNTEDGGGDGNKVEQRY